jgi:hypothetical protein
MERCKNPTRRKAFHNSGRITPDGMQLSWLMERMGCGSISRVLEFDPLLAVFRQSAQTRWK